MLADLEVYVAEDVPGEFVHRVRRSFRIAKSHALISY